MTTEPRPLLDELAAALRGIVGHGCPKDTNGDGDCGRKNCPYCGAQTRAALARYDAERSRCPEAPAGLADRVMRLGR